MKIAILSRNAKLYSTASLVEAGRKRGHRVRVLDPLRCYMRIEPGKFLIRYKSRQLSGVDAVIPRIGNSITFYGTAVLRQFEMMGVFTPNTSDAVLRARDKLRCMQLLAREGIGLPTTVFGDNPDDTADLLSLLGDPPHVIKLNEGAQGQGVLLAEKATASQGMIEALRGLYANFLVQEFIRESKGADIRCFVVGGKVVAAMQRQARDGEFRSNLHRGGTATAVQLSSAETDTALHAARTVGLNIAGVDLLRSKRGPLVLEVNSSPGLEGIEATTGVDVAGHIIDYLESRVRRRKSATAAKSANGVARAAKPAAAVPSARAAHATKAAKTVLGRQ